MLILVRLCEHINQRYPPVLKYHGKTQFVDIFFINTALKRGAFSIALVHFFFVSSRGLLWVIPGFTLLLPAVCFCCPLYKH